MTVVEDGLVEMREKVFQLMRGTQFTAVIYNEVSLVQLSISTGTALSLECSYRGIFGGGGGGGG